MTKLLDFSRKKSYVNFVAVTKQLSLRAFTATRTKKLNKFFFSFFFAFNFNANERRIHARIKKKIKTTHKHTAVRTILVDKKEQHRRYIQHTHLLTPSHDIFVVRCGEFQVDLKIRRLLSPAIFYIICWRWLELAKRCFYSRVNANLETFTIS